MRNNKEVNRASQTPGQPKETESRASRQPTRDVRSAVTGVSRRRAQGGEHLPHETVCAAAPGKRGEEKGKARCRDNLPGGLWGGAAATWPPDRAASRPVPLSCSTTGTAL